MNPHGDPWGVTMTRAELCALLACAGQDPKGRPHLATLVIKSDGVYATDGAMLAVARFDNPLPDRTLALPSVPLEHLSRAVPEGGGVRLTFRGPGNMKKGMLVPPDRAKLTVAAELSVNNWQMGETLFEAYVPILDDVVPPDYEAVLSKNSYEPQNHSEFDVSRLQSLALIGQLGIDEAVRSAGYEIAGGAELQVGCAKDAHPLRVDYNHGQTRWTVLLMPHREY